MLLFLILSTITFAQTDKNENPVFNSMSIDEIIIDDNFKLVVNYYTLENNIENPLSSVYISKKPSEKEIIESATELMSYNFLLLKDQKMVDLIAFNEKPLRAFNLINLKSGKVKDYKSKIKGDISENRANEIIDNKFDHNSKIENNILTYNGKTYSIYSKQEVIDEILNIIKNNKHLKDKVSDTQIPTKAELQNYIIEQTKPYNSLDFFTEIKGKEYDGVQIKPGVYATLQSIAFYKWGRANYELGVNTYQDAFSIYAKIKGKELNIKEKQSIKSGFNKD
ncbi:hypothetical protein SAMN04488096_1026 [Mesonia phycicola]|uniref:Uncharacterized protein n=1 Tax=Mesonia phycicola TaxID=579105 RepID=A0A1M6BF10_9FLAO|nr:hypothetical protein [Mesonia phycicola]SHI47276.1 hypothetical protein SAMN04488096_1026 [Mesonia phycicola]